MDELFPEKVFERRWALSALEQSTTRLRDEYQAAGQTQLFKRLKSYVEGGTGTPSYAETAISLDPRLRKNGDVEGAERGFRGSANGSGAGGESGRVKRGRVQDGASGGGLILAQAETLLLACGFRPTEKASNLRDVLTCSGTGLADKLTNLGVAPETVEEARKAIIASVAPPPVEEPPVPSGPPDRSPSTSPMLPPSPAAPVAPSPGPSDAPPERKASIGPRPHPETGLPAQEWLRAKLTSILTPKGWQVSAGEVATDGSESRTDIVLKSPSGSDYLVEAKRVEAGKVFWREKQIQSARTHLGKYFIALLLPTGTETYEVRWVCDPLLSFPEASPDVNWIWKDHAGTGGFAPDWVPRAEPPCLAADSYKAVIRVRDEFVESLPSGIEAILSLLAHEVTPAV